MCRKRALEHTTTQGYEPQSNGTAESAVGLAKTQMRRITPGLGMEQSCWEYALKFTCQSYMCKSLGLTQASPPFGSKVIAAALNKRNRG
eukprot:5812913-Amphidinium_carterae.1